MTIKPVNSTPSEGISSTNNTHKQLKAISWLGLNWTYLQSVGNKISDFFIKFIKNHKNYPVVCMYMSWDLQTVESDINNFKKSITTLTLL